MTTVEAPIPEFLRPMFEGTTLAEGPATLVALAPDGTILWVNAAWREFARANDGDDVLRRFGPGQSYFAGAGGPLRSFYEGVVQNALLTGEPFEQDYECSSAEVFRIYHLRVLPFGVDGLLLEHSLVVERPHEQEDHDAVEPCYRNASGMIVQCANCRRVRRAEGDAWDWVRPWVSDLPTNTSHGICSACMGYYWPVQVRRSP